MKKLLLVIVIFLGISTSINAQDYKIGAGIRLGITPGFSAKYFLSETTALEGMFTSRYHGAIFTGLVEKQYNVFEEIGISLFFGGGAHLGRWRGSNIHPWFKDNKSHHVIGLDAICGFEYFFTNMPMSISLDWKPEINLINYNNIEFVEGAITLRWLFFDEKL